MNGASQPKPNQGDAACLQTKITNLFHETGFVNKDHSLYRDFIKNAEFTLSIIVKIKNACHEYGSKPVFRKRN